MKSSTFLTIVLMANVLFVKAQCPTSWQGDHVICYNYGFQSVQIGPSDDDADPGYTYSWFPTNTLRNAFTRNPTAFCSTTTTYTMTVSGPGCSVSIPVTVYVGGKIYIKEPDGSIVHAASTNDIYFDSGITPAQNIEFHSVPQGIGSSSTQWISYPSLTSLGFGEIYNYTVSGAHNDNIYVSVTDENGNTCPTDVPSINTYPNTYPSGITVNKNYSVGCPSNPTLPATIGQTTSLSSGTSYFWAVDNGNWSISSPFSSSATLSHAGSSSPDQGIITASAYNPTYASMSGYEIRMIYPVNSYNSGCHSISSSLLSGNASRLDDATAKAILYPNPAHSFVTISAPEPIQQIEISSMSGMTVKRIQPGAVKSYTIFTSSLPSGLYVCKLLLAGNKVQLLQFAVGK